MMPMKTRVPVSVFASSVSYCQYYIINRFHLGIVPEISKAQLIGKKIHDRLEKEDLLIPREEATKEELLDPFVDLDLPRESMKISIERTNKGDFLYVGRMDKVIREEGNIYIIDDKVSSKKRKLYPDRILQLSCYCEGFTSNHAEQIAFEKIFFKVVQRNHDGDIIDETEREYSDKLKKSLIKHFGLFEGIFNKDVQPKHHHNPNKCRACGFKCFWRMK